MRSVDRYRAWALRGPFHLSGDSDVIPISWPDADALLSHDPRDPRAVQLVRLAGDQAEQVLDLVGGEDFTVLDLILDDLAEYFGCVRSRQLAGLIERYGSAIANDLQQVYQLDMLGVFRGDLLPEQLMERIDGLPRHSWLSEALAQDDELAAHSDVYEDDDEPQYVQPKVRHTEWTPETERLTVVIDRLGDISSMIASIAGSKMNIPREPRPVGASERLKASKDDTAFQEILGDVEAAQARWRLEHPNESP